MKKKLFLHAIICLIICIYQISFVSGLPLPIAYVDIVSISIIFVLLIRGFEFALLWVVFSGLVMDTILFFPFGAHMIAFFISFLFVNSLNTNYFTDKSLYSTIILFVVLLFTQNLILYLLSSLFYAFNIVSQVQVPLLFFKYEMAKITINIVFMALLFYTLSFFTNNLKSVFLKKAH
ncbi:hypothetical protein ISS03_00945 [Patescibacteria group bacterium]|nr:hypothetical protein [Patescibacteria group bacterium]